jgi:hypothetical protein
MIETLAKVGAFLLEHADLVDEIYELIASGVSKESIKKAIRALKVKVSDQALKEELGLE